MTVISDNPRHGVPTLTFSVYRDNIFKQAMQADVRGFARLACADAAMRYNFILRNFAMVKDRNNSGGHIFSKKFLNNIRLTHDLRIANEKDLIWFTLQYENVNCDHVVDFPDLLDIA